MRSRAMLFFGTAVIGVLLSSGPIRAQDAEGMTAAAVQSGAAVEHQAVFILAEDGRTCAAETGSQEVLFLADREPRCCGQCTTSGKNRRRGCWMTINRRTYCSPC